MHSFLTSLVTKIVAGTLGVASATGAVVVLANDAPPAPSAQTVASAEQASPPVVHSEPVAKGGLVLEPVVVVAPPPVQPAQAAQAAPKAVKSKAPAATKVSVAAVSDQVKAACTSLVAGKLGDLKDFIKKTAAEDPSLAAGAAKVLAKLDAYDGGGLCAADLNQVRDSLCADGEIAATLRKLVSKTSFMVRMTIGDPCTADMEKLSKLAAQYA